MAGAAAPKDEADAESQIAYATYDSDCPEATATSPVRHDPTGNPDLPEQAPDTNPSPAENDLLPTAEGYVTQPAELDDGGCFEPFIERRPPTLGELIDKARDLRYTAPRFTPPRVATAAELILWIMHCLLAQTHLPVDTAKLIAFWVISTLFQTELTILPCLLITGPAYDAGRVLRMLKNFCREAALLAGFRRNDISRLSSFSTLLISEPDLDKRTASSISGLTDKEFLVACPWIAPYSKSTAIYAGENPDTRQIQNAIRIHIAPTNAGLPDPPEWLGKMTERLPVHLGQYRDKNLNSVLHSKWVPPGLSAETAAIATALGSCIVDAPELRLELLALLQTRDQQRLSALSNTREAVVLEALLALIREGREQAYSGEIATKADRLFEARGETGRMKAENVGHMLKRLGLPTRRLSQKGNGLIFDKATAARIRELAAAYTVDVMEDTPAEPENLHSRQTTENNETEVDMEVMEFIDDL